MSDDEAPEPQPGRPWDEYDWERFLQQQDRKTDEYLRLLEKYADHPDRDAIIAKEMGWDDLEDESGHDWGNDLDEIFAEEAETESDPDRTAATGDDEAAQAAELRVNRERHPLASDAFNLTLQVSKWIGTESHSPEGDAAASQLFAGVSNCGAKLSAALGDDYDELGMTLAYLKRGLKSITGGLEAIEPCRRSGLITAAQADELQRRIFAVRGGIIELMGTLRGEFRRRHGGEQ
ncbi:hypothetical protein AYO41_02950 [Verrucomicrobia bacterium SCGC AG-212-E04]|nr:hypothetical protein AYO41_02950 [Verrucomicrobia bacterium SCGC AG-212-E04]